MLTMSPHKSLNFNCGNNFTLCEKLEYSPSDMVKLVKIDLKGQSPLKYGHAVYVLFKNHRAHFFAESEYCVTQNLG